MKMGLDLSINNTGIAIQTQDKTFYYLITSKETRSLKKIKHNRFDYLTYSKTDEDDDNIFEICHKIKYLINKHNITYITLEAPALNAKGRAAVTIAGLNYSVRQMLKELQIPYNLIQPTALKKEFTGNGCADKELMCYCWKILDPISNELKGIKVDDLADAYALLNFSHN